MPWKGGVASTAYETCGFLRKRGRIVPTWKRRFFVLQKFNFFYFNDEFRTVCLGRDSVVSVEAWKKKPLGLLVTSQVGRVFYLLCDSTDDRDRWLEAFIRAVEQNPNVQSLAKETAYIRGPTSRLNKTHSEEDSYEPPITEDDNSRDRAHNCLKHPSACARSSLGIEDFKLISTLGKGGFGKVLKVSKLKSGEDTGRVFAMKIMKKEFLLKHKMRAKTMLERDILLNLEHPFVVKMRYAFQSAEKLYMVMDFYGGGSLFYHLEMEGAFSEDCVKFFSAQLVLGVQYLHDNGIVYRDLKLENILMDTQGNLAITDFGLSKEIDPSNRMWASTFCGTPLYVAPEMVHRRKYGFAVDWWALGIIMYELLSCRVPFCSRNMDRVLWKIVNATPTFSSDVFSTKAQSIIEGLLNKRPSQRLGSGPGAAEHIKGHPFFENFDFDKCAKKELCPPFIPPATYKGEKNVLGMEPIDTMQGEIDPKHIEGFDKFTFCESCEHLALGSEVGAELQQADQETWYDDIQPASKSPAHTLLSSAPLPMVGHV